MDHAHRHRENFSNVKHFLANFSEFGVVVTTPIVCALEELVFLGSFNPGDHRPSPVVMRRCTSAWEPTDRGNVKTAVGFRVQSIGTKPLLRINHEKSLLDPEVLGQCCAPSQWPHSRSVRPDTPSSDANFTWESPVRSRMVATGGTVITRPTSPRFNWRSPSRISIPTFRFATALAIDFILDPFKNVSRDVLCYVLGVESQHPDLSLAGAQKINDAESSAFATAGDAPAHLAHAAGAGDDRAGFGISNKRLLELRIFIVAQIFLHETREQLGLAKADHASLYGSA